MSSSESEIDCEIVHVAKRPKVSTSKKTLGDFWTPTPSSRQEEEE